MTYPFKLSTEIDLWNSKPWETEPATLLPGIEPATMLPGLEPADISHLRPDEPNPLLQKIGYYGAGALEKALLPFTLYGMKMKETTEQPFGFFTSEHPSISPLAPINILAKGSRLAFELGKAKSEERDELLAEEWQKDIATYAPGGERYEEYRELPWYQQLILEAPAWAMTSGVGATGIRAALAPAAARGGIRAVPAIAARGALYPLAGIERILGYLPGKALQRIAKTRWTRAQAVQWAELDATAQKVMLEELDVVLRANPALATRATPQTISNIADGMKRILLAGEYRPEVIAARYGITGVPEAGYFVSSQYSRQLIRSYSRFALEWASPTKPKFAIDALRGLGFTDKAIQKMTLETVEKQLVANLGTRGTLIAILKAYEPGVDAEAVADFVMPETIAPEAIPEIPKAEVGMPEAGLQRAVFGVPEKEVYPIGKGELTQISLDDQLKLAKAREDEIFPIRPVEEVSTELTGIDAEIAGLRSYIQSEQATRLVNLIKKTGWHKGEISNLTFKQYRDITGKTAIKPGILTADRKHIRWEYALDDAATEMGYESGEALKYAIEDIGDKAIQSKKLAQIRNSLADELARAESALAPAPVEATPASIVADLQRLYSDIGTEVESFQVIVKGLKGDEAKVARETLGGLQRELRYVERTLSSFEKRPDMPDATTLRQTIMAWAKYKGLSQQTLRDIYHSVAGRRQLHLIPQEQLMEIIAKVKVARPKSIKTKAVITAKTERKIQSLKGVLKTKGQMTEGDFTRIMGELRIDTPRYISQYRFPTESQGKSLIRAMLDDAEWIGQRGKVESALAKKPKIAEKVDSLNRRIETKKQVVIEGKPVAKIIAYQDMRYYAMSLESKTGAPFYWAWQWLNSSHLENRHAHTKLLQRLIDSTPDYGRIAGSDEALQRVSDYIASKNRLGPKAPANITPGEIKLANEIEAVLLEFRSKARLGKFDEGYDLYRDNIQRMKSELIPDAPIEDLRRAIDIYESRGRDALIEYLDTRTWGVIKSGYEPLSVVDPKIFLRKVRATALGKGHIRVREGIVYPPQDRNILQRFSSYTKQMLNLNLASPIRKTVRVYDESVSSLERPAKVAEELARDINEMKGYADIGGPMAYFLSRVYAQTMAAVFWDPFKWLRNKCQNLAFHPDRQRYFLPSTWKPLPQQDLIYFDTYVSQMRGMKEDYMMRSFKAFPGLGRTTRLANQTSLYPWSDQTNRLESYQMRKNRVNEALAKYEEDGDIDKLIERSGLTDLEPIQQREALELLAQDTVEYPVPELSPVSGKEAFARYNAKEVTNNTHFMYERSQRSPAEMGPVGRILGNLFAFPRSYAQRLIFQGNKLRPGSTASGAEKRYALKTIVGILICGMLIGEAFKKVTGRKYNPYNPINILSWTPGGLTIGAAEEISSTLYDIASALTGDGDALSRATASIPAASKLFLPFYRQLIYTIEAATDKKNIDRYALRKLRALIDKEYQPRETAYEIDRNFFAMMQHALFGGEPEIPDPYRQIENQIWSQYPGSLRRLSDEIKRLEKTDPTQARKLLYENPEILEARRLIAIAHNELKRKEAIEEREKALAGR